MIIRETLFRKLIVLIAMYLMLARQADNYIRVYRNQIRHKTQENSVITEHRIDSGHDFKWEDVEVLDTEPILSKRLTSEMLFIKRQRNGINLRRDTEGLHQLYSDTIERLPKL